MTLRVRDLDPEWVQAQRRDAAEIAMWADDLSKSRHFEMLAALAAAITALQEIASPAVWCKENDGCTWCIARRALDTVVSGEES